MTIIRKAESNDFDRVFPLFSGFATHTQVDPTDWKKIFTNYWSEKNEPVGYLLEDGGKPVGFLGTLFSQRVIDMKKYLFCNLTSWIVHPEYRSESLKLLFPLLARKDLTITNFTASNRVSEVLLKLGFQDLEDSFRIIPPLPVPGGGIYIEYEISKIREILDEANRKILDDHEGLHCVHVLVKSDRGYCYIVLNPAIKKGKPVLYVNYLSDLDVFLAQYHIIAFHLCRKFKFYGLMVGEHTLKGYSLPLTLNVRRKHSLLFRSQSLQAYDIDTLYSEIQLLGLKPV